MTPDETARLKSRLELDWVKDELEYLLIDFDGIVLNEKAEEVIAKWIINREAAKDCRIEVLEGALKNIAEQCQCHGHVAKLALSGKGGK